MVRLGRCGYTKNIDPDGNVIEGSNQIHIE